MRAFLVCALGVAISVFAGPLALAGTAIADREVVVLVVGDVGLNGDGQRLSERGGFRQGDLVPWGEATRGVAGLIDGDLNFANLETVVTARDDLAAAPRL